MRKIQRPQVAQGDPAGLDDDLDAGDDPA